MTATRCSPSSSPTGPACHTGERTCFHHGELEPPAPHEALPALERTLAERAAAERPEGSYTVELLDDPPRIGAKVQEEAEEVARAAREEPDERVDEEAADVLYHLTVLLHARGRGARRRRGGAQWPSPLGGRTAHPSCPSSRRSTRCASWRASTTSSPCATASSTTSRRRSAPSSSCAGATRSSPPSCSSPPSRASASGASASSACARARSCAGRWATAATPTRWPPPRSAPSARRRSPRRRRSPGGAVGFFGYDLVRTVEPLGDPNPDAVGLPDMALMLSDVLVVFDHLKHTITILVNVYADDGDLDAAYADALATIEKARRLLAGPVPAIEPTPSRARPDLRLQHAARAVRGRWSRGSSSTCTPATPSRSCPPSAGAPSSTPIRSRSTAACGWSTRARTCTSWTSWTSRSPAPRPSRC